MKIRVFKLLTIIACCYLLISEIYIFITLIVSEWEMVIKWDLLYAITTLISSLLAITVVTSIMLKIFKDRFSWLKIIYNIFLTIVFFEAVTLIISKTYICLKHPLNIFLESFSFDIKLNYIGAIFSILTSVVIIVLVVNQFKTIRASYKAIVISLSIIVGLNVVLEVLRNIASIEYLGQMPMRGVVLSVMWSSLSNFCYFTVLCYGFRKNEHPIELEQVVEN